MHDIDFLPHRIRQQRARRAWLLRQGYLLGAVAAALVGWTATSGHRVSEARGELALLQRTNGNMARQLALKSDLERQLADLLIKERISKHLGSRVNVLDLMHEMERLLPASMFLRSLDVDTVAYLPEGGEARGRNGTRRPEAAGAGGRAKFGTRLRLVITGLGPDDVAVANFIGQLSASPLFEDVNMGYTRNTVHEGRSAREFQASCYVAR